MIIVVATDRRPPGWTVAYLYIGSTRPVARPIPDLLVDHDYHSGFNSPLHAQFMPMWHQFRNFTAAGDEPARYIKKSN